MNHVEQFNNALAAVNDERGKVYGHPLDNFQRIARMQAELKDCADPAVRHALEMICVKMARLVETPDHLDSVIDIAGYARTIAMVLERRAEEPTAEAAAPAFEPTIRPGPIRPAPGRWSCMNCGAYWDADVVERPKCLAASKDAMCGMYCG